MMKYRVVVTMPNGIEVASFNQHLESGLAWARKEANAVGAKVEVYERSETLCLTKTVTAVEQKSAVFHGE